MRGKPMEVRLERQTKGQESESSVQDELGGATTHDDGHPPFSSLRSHCTRSFHRAGQRDVGTTRRIRKVCRKQALILASDPRRCDQATGPISASICSLLEAGWKRSTPGFWQAPDASATLDGALFNTAQIVDSFSRDMEMQTSKRVGGRSLSAGMEKGVITDFAKKSRSQLISEKTSGLSGFLNYQRTSLACGWLDSQPICLCSLRPENLGQEASNAGMSRQQPDQSRTHEGIRPPCDTGAGILEH